MAEQRTQPSSQYPAGGGEKICLEGLEPFRSHCQEIVKLASQQIGIFTRDLDATLYDRQPFLEAVKNLAIQGKFCPVRILLQTNNRVQQKGHRLVDLARRLPSSIQIRRPHPDYINHQENFLVADQIHYMKWNPDNRYQGVAAYDDRLEARQLNDFFALVWECSEPDSDLRRLNI